MSSVIRGFRRKRGIASTLAEARGQRKGYPELVKPVPGLTGVVLAGGSGRRFGGNKAAALFDGRPLVAWVVEALGRACERVLVVAGASTALPPLPAAVDRLDDLYPGEGPLGGLLTAMRAIGQGRVFAAACDMPLIDEQTVRKVAAALASDPGADAAVPLAGGRLQPLAAAYDVARCLPVLDAAFSGGERRLRVAVERLRLASVGGLGDGGRSLLQVNTKADLAAVAARASSRRGSETQERG
jgi:molybdopterin-guanine dinucleotide biosynthesis protein A